MRKLFLLFWFFVLTLQLEAAPISVVAAENMYGKLGEQIGGRYVRVTSILTDPNQDPHMFSNTPEFAIAFSQANLVVYNGLDYDPWVHTILDTSGTKQIIVVADLLGKNRGDNPHIWYDPKTMPLLAQAYAQKLAKIDPDHATFFDDQVEQFKSDYQPLLELIAKIKEKYQGAPIVATEPLFNDMADALGLNMLGKGFQISIMHGTTPTGADIQEFEFLLTQHKVKALIYNTQVSNASTDKMIALAKTQGIPTIGVSETQPKKTTYILWMTTQLTALEKALSGQ